jgi:TPP-dependent pyruvate/acetoin dehydrogenase alpha subunit
MGALSDEELAAAYTMMCTCRNFEDEARLEYMVGWCRLTEPS